MSAFDTKTWVNGEGNANARLNDDALNDLETRVDEAFEAGLQVDDTGTGHGPLIGRPGGATFSGTFDPVIYFGYNYLANGNADEAGEPRGGFVFEADYNDGAKRTMEAYVEFHNAANTLQVRPFFAQVKRDATTEATFQTATALQGDVINFLGTADEPVNAPSLFKFEENRLTIQGQVGASLGSPYLRVESAAGGGSSVRLGYDATLDHLMLETQGANHAAITLGTRRNLTLYSTPNGVNGSGISVGDVVDNSAVGLFAVANSHVGVKALVARGKASQSGSLFEAQKSDGNAWWLIDAAGFPRWVDTTLQQTTVGAAGGASALPATPTKYLKVKDSAGTTLVIPAYAAS